MPMSYLSQDWLRQPKKAGGEKMNPWEKIHPRQGCRDKTKASQEAAHGKSYGH